MTGDNTLIHSHGINRRDFMKLCAALAATMGLSSKAAAEMAESVTNPQLNGTATLRVWHPRGPDQVEVWAFCITDKAASDEVKAAFENSATRAFGPAGFLEQDDSENWCEIQKLLKGHRARNSKLCLEMGLGQEKRRDDGIPGITNYIFSETAARGMYQRWADLLSSESWQEVLDKTAAYQQEVMK